MGLSYYEKTTSEIRNVASSKLVGEGEVRLPLNKDHLTSEHILNVKVSQAFGTAPLSAGNIFNMIDSIVLETDHGQLVNCDGLSLASLASFTETQPNSRFTLAATSTAQLFVDLHHENDGAFHDLLTALETGKLSKLDLVIRFKDPATSGVFVGGAVPAVPSFDVRVSAITYPELTGLGDEDYQDGIDEDTGESVPEVNTFRGIGTLLHRVNTQRINGNTKGLQAPIRLQSAGGQLRFLQLLTLDTATGLPVDNVIKAVRLTVKGREIRVLDFDEIQAGNEAKRGLDRLNSGLATLDFGDREGAFLDLEDVREALLVFEIHPNAPATWEVRSTEDYTEER